MPLCNRVGHGTNSTGEKDEDRGQIPRSIENQPVKICSEKRKISRTLPEKPKCETKLNLNLCQCFLLQIQSLLDNTDSCSASWTLSLSNSLIKSIPPPAAFPVSATSFAKIYLLAFESHGCTRKRGPHPRLSLCSACRQQHHSNSHSDNISIERFLVNSVHSLWKLPSSVTPTDRFMFNIAFAPAAVIVSIFPYLNRSNLAYNFPPHLDRRILRCEPLQQLIFPQISTIGSFFHL